MGLMAGLLGWFLIAGVTSAHAQNSGKVICSFCKGTKRSPYPTYVGYYGLSEGRRKWCDICEARMSRHYHKVCPVCNGLGYWRMPR